MGDYDVVARGFLRSKIWRVTRLFRKREPKAVPKEPQQVYFADDLIAIYTVFSFHQEILFLLCKLL